MTAPKTDVFLTSALPDVHDVPLDTDINLDDVEYTRIMSQILIADDESGAVVSAFNSSI